MKEKKLYLSETFDLILCSKGMQGQFLRGEIREVYLCIEFEKLHINI